MSRCSSYVGIACVDGSCPMANEDEYIEYGIPTTNSCDECSSYKGCEDCALNGTEYCTEEDKVEKYLEGNNEDQSNR